MSRPLHNGLAQSVRSLLRKGKPLTARQIVNTLAAEPALNANISNVGSTLINLVGQGEVRRAGEKRPYTYESI